MKHNVEGNMFRFVCLGICLLGVPAAAADWPQWRGPDGQGHAPTARDLPSQAKKWLAVTIFNGEQRYLAERGRLR